MTLSRVGGLAALFEAGAFIFGFYIYFMVLGPASYGAPGVDPSSHIAFLANNRALMSIFNLVIYIGFGAALVILALALHQRTRAASPAVADAALGFAMIWATLVIASGMIANIGIGVLVQLNARAAADAALIWPAYAMVTSGLGGGNEIVGGLWILLVTASAWRSKSTTRPLPRPVNYLGFIVAASGLATTAPALGELGAVFGMGAIIWFVLVGSVLLRSPAKMTHNHAIQSQPA